MKYNCIVILGATATGKTKLACELAYKHSGEIISADSRQVYKSLNIGTGKDLNEYEIHGQKIPYHLIDIIEPTEQYYLHEYINDFESAFKEITSKNKLPIICGGTGLYLDILHKDFSLTQIPENNALRIELEQKQKEELIHLLKNYPETIWQHIDFNSKKRIVRGIEIAEFLKNNPNFQFNKSSNKNYKPIYFGIKKTKEEINSAITQRLQSRLQQGLIEEVQNLLNTGLSQERILKFGLEYKYILLFILGKLSREGMILQLQTAIFQFAKRQLTWFKKMEKEGIEINWGSVEDILNSKLPNLH